MLLRPRDLRPLQRGGDPAPAEGALDAGEVVERAVAPLLQQRELREAGDLAVRERDEDGVRVIAGAAHVAGEPLFERADVVLLLAGDVAGRLACDLP